MQTSASTMQIACPGCQSALAAPAHLAGATVQCPRCQCQMVVPSMPAQTSATVSASSPRIEELLPPSAVAEPSAAPSAGRAVFRAASKPTATPSATDTVRSESELTATFKRAAATTSTAPSKLPTLQLASVSDPSPRDAVAPSRGPLLIVLLVVSMLASAALLLWDPSVSALKTPGEHYVWEQLETIYFGAGDDLKAYQRLLREAQQAEHRGDTRQRDARLREVLELLRAEQTNPAFGVTGYQTPAPPNDQHLEELVMTLLREK